jgi:hypothetical protein
MTVLYEAYTNLLPPRPNLLGILVTGIELFGIVGIGSSIGQLEMV